LTIPARAELSSNVVSVLFRETAAAWHATALISFAVGAFAAAITSGFTSKFIGRKLSLQIASLIFLLGAFIQIGETSNINFIYGACRPLRELSPD
jgi:hypothetical protein